MKQIFALIRQKFMRTANETPALEIVVYHDILTPMKKPFRLAYLLEKSNYLDL